MQKLDVLDVGAVLLCRLHHLRHRVDADPARAGLGLVVNRELLQQLAGGGPDLVTHAVVGHEEIAELADNVMPLGVKRHRLLDMLDEGLRRLAGKAPARVLGLDIMSNTHVSLLCFLCRPRGQSPYRNSSSNWPGALSARTDPQA